MFPMVTIWLYDQNICILRFFNIDVFCKQDTLCSLFKNTISSKSLHLLWENTTSKNHYHTFKTAIIKVFESFPLKWCTDKIVSKNIQDSRKLQHKNWLREGDFATLVKLDWETKWSNFLLISQNYNIYSKFG